jgi:predicted phage-related endonuclease
MKTAVKYNLEDAALCLEDLLKRYDDDKLSRQEKVDVCARLRGAASTIEKLDKAIKAEIKAWRDGKEGTVKGEIFQAVCSINDRTALDQKALKEAEPRTYDKYAKTTPVFTINFSPR